MEKESFNPYKVAAFVAAVSAFVVAAQDPSGPFADVVTWVMAVVVFAAIVALFARLMGWMLRHTLR